jgi:hypothetical protein
MAFAVALLPDAGGGLSVPSLPLAMGVALPWFGHTLRAPSMLLGTAIAAPLYRIPDPPDIAALATPFQQRYRLYLIETGDITELPLASIQCRRRRGASTWLTVEIPGYSAAMAAQCRAHIGGEIIIYHGVVDANGERLGEFLRAVLTEVETEEGARGGSIVLTGRVQTPSYDLASRALIGVSSLIMDDGVRSAECVVDPLLRPGDTVDDGESSWVVGRLEYRISPRESRMVVTEALS